MRRTGKRPSGRDYWDGVLWEPRVKQSDDFWRRHLHVIYRALRDRWRWNGEVRRLLKTDLYDEAISTHSVLSLFGQGCQQVVGMDLSLEVARAVLRAMGGESPGRCGIVVSDARCQGFRSNVFDEILSNSTLDHFSGKEEIVRSLQELRRILRPGGSLIITLDNPWNPVVFLRNQLPYRLLKSLGLIPFYMGATLSGPELARTLEANGFRVCARTAIVHAPRILAIRGGRLLERFGSERMKSRVRGVLGCFELLEKLPTKCLTGYYVAVKAVRAR